MDMISKLADAGQWQLFYEYKLAGGHLTVNEVEELESFICKKEYLKVVNHIRSGGTFAPPRKACISKMHSEKKRIVYIYTKEENYVLKLLTFLLQQKYDYLFADNLYSFRMGLGVKDAIKRITHAPGIRQMWSYKVDISNYFNSISVDHMLLILRETLTDEPKTCDFIASLLENPLVEDQGTLVPEEKGIMAGTPISTFLANLYLSEMDHYFWEKGVLYARYSDDIIVFDTTKEALEQDAYEIQKYLASCGLSINEKKEYRTKPEEMWTFLGICYKNGVIDVSPVSVEKLKGKMRRKSRALMRWKAQKGALGVHAAKAYIRSFNRKLFENPVEHELTWTRWYFPLINTAESLKIIDNYSQSCIRYLATGKRTKSAYNFRYEDMKKLGYISLVNCYYKHQRELIDEKKDIN